MKLFLSYQDQFGRWIKYQTKDNERDAFRVAKLKASQMNKRFRITSQDGTLLDLIDI